MVVVLVVIVSVADANGISAERNASTVPGQERTPYVSTRWLATEGVGFGTKIWCGRYKGGKTASSSSDDDDDEDDEDEEEEEDEDEEEEEEEEEVEQEQEEEREREEVILSRRTWVVPPDAPSRIRAALPS